MRFLTAYLSRSRWNWVAPTRLGLSLLVIAGTLYTLAYLTRIGSASV